MDSLGRLGAKSMTKIAMLGTTDSAYRVLRYVEDTGFARVVGFFDDFIPRGESRFGRPVLGSMADIPRLHAQGIFDSVANTIGYQHREFRRQIYDSLVKCGIPRTTFVHPTTFVAPSATVGDGTIILMNCTIDNGVVIGPNLFMTAMVNVSHDSRLGAHCFISSMVNLCGRTTIGECCWLGASSTVIDHVTLGRNVQTGAGAVVVNDLPDNVLALGVPAKIVRKLQCHADRGSKTKGPRLSVMDK